MQAERSTVPWPWLALVALCALLYLFGLDNPYAPTNGDEMVYIHIARLTALSNHWLPLVSDLDHMRNTKPPMLFWQALWAGDWGRQWSLLALRLPSVVYTFATTILVALLALRISAQARTACIAAALYLLYFSTFRYGRVYLTSAPETFWFGLPVLWLVWQRSAPQADAAVAPPGWLQWVLCGLAMGIGALYKSFALVAPAAATLWCAVLASAPARNGPTVLRTTLGSGTSGVLAIGLFSQWFVFDPDP
ncbi:MAG: ArnT family glycosyltransferase, partial [Rhodoferax sp.]